MVARAAALHFFSSQEVWVLRVKVTMVPLGLVLLPAVVAEQLLLLLS
jgi:hypothetical protein